MKVRSTLLSVSFLCCLVSLCALTRTAQAAPPTVKRDVTSASAKPTKTPLPRSGTLSQSVNSGSGGRAVDMPWGGDDDLFGNKKDDSAPITGSVSKVANRDWIMKIFNNSEDTYSVNLELRQLSEKGNKVKSDFYSYTLKSKEAKERKILANPSTKNCALNLVSWKNLTNKKTEAKGEATPVAAPPATPDTAQDQP